MAEKIIAATLQVNSGQAETSVKSFKAELREANEELVLMSKKFGATSDQAVTAAKKVAGLKDAIADAKGLTDAFNPDAKFRAFSNAISGVVGGFSGLTGAMALFGGQSKDVEQVLLKVQAAMALSQGVNAVMEAKDAFIQLGAKIKDIGIFQKANAVANQLAAGTMKLFGVAVESTSTSFKVLKGAIIATGIGVLVVLIGEAISAFNEFSSAAQKAEEAQKKFNDEVKAGADISLKADLQSIKRQTDIDIAKAKLAGVSEKEIQKIQEQSLKDQAAARKRHFIDIKNIDAQAAADDLAAGKDLQNQLTLSQLNFKLQEKQRAEAAAKERKEESDKRIAANKVIAEKEAADKKELEKKMRLDNIEAKKEADKEAVDFFKGLEKEEADKKAQQIKDDQDSVNTKIELGKQITASEKEQAAERIATRQAEVDAKLAISNAELGLVSQFGNLLQQIAGKNKAIAAAGIIVENAAGIAKVIVNTGVANAKAIAAFPLTFGQPWVTINTISAALSIASSIAATQKALSQIGGGGNVGTAPSLKLGSTGGATAPLTPEVQTTKLDQDQINNAGSAVANKPVRAFILDGDIQDNTERNTRLSRAARLGGG